MTRRRDLLTIPYVQNNHRAIRPLKAYCTLDPETPYQSPHPPIPQSLVLRLGVQPITELLETTTRFNHQ